MQGSGSSVQSPSAMLSPSPLRTRSQHGILKPKVRTDGTVRYGKTKFVGLSTIKEPNNLHEAFESKNWKNAMDEEYNALVHNRTWHLVPLARGRNIIDCKWVYRIRQVQG